MAYQNHTNGSRFDTSNLVSYYQFENNSNDSQGSKNLTTNNTTYTTGDFGTYGAVCSRPSSKYLYINDKILTANVNNTISFWINFASIPASTEYWGIIDHYNGSPYNLNLGLYLDNDPSRHINFSYNIMGSDGGGNFGGSITVGFTPTTGVWYHIVQVCDFTGTGKLYGYINGVSQGTPPNITAANGLTTYEDACGIGTFYGHRSAHDAVNATIDELVFEERAWSATEVANYYNSPNNYNSNKTNHTGGSRFDTTGLRAYYQFNDNGLDSSGNGYNLTLDNTPSYVTGKFSDSISLNGTSSQQYAYINGSDLGVGTNSFTIMGWIKPVSQPSGNYYQTLEFLNRGMRTSVTYTSVGGSPYRFYYSAEVGEAGGMFSSDFQYTFSTTDFTLLAYTFDASTVKLSCYINGNIQGIPLTGGTFPGVLTGTGFAINMELINYPDNKNVNQGNWIADEVMVFSRVLSGSEILDYYNNPNNIAIATQKPKTNIITIK